MKKTAFLDSAHKVLSIEAKAITQQLDQLGRTFEEACQPVRLPPLWRAPEHRHSLCTQVKQAMEIWV